MISKPNLSFSLMGGNLFTRECCHDVILHVPAIGSRTQCHILHVLFLSVLTLSDRFSADCRRLYQMSSRDLSCGVNNLLNLKKILKKHW